MAEDNPTFLLAKVHQSFLEHQTKVHREYLNIHHKFYQKAAQIFLPKKKVEPLQNIKVKHQYLFDPAKESWIYDHCPTFTRPALAMTSIVDIMASQCEEYFPHKKLIAITDVRVFQWATLDRPKMITTEINKLDHEHAQATIFLQKDNKDVRIAQGKLTYADSYMNPHPHSSPAPLATKIEKIPNPYSYLFHGPAFQTIRSLKFGQEGSAKGSTMILDAHNPLAPSGCLNHILLDGATQGVYHENGLSFWRDELPDNHVCYPALLRYINFYEKTPPQGLIRCETRFVDFHYSKTLPIFRMTLINDDKIWCEFELVYAVLPMGFMAMGNLKDKKSFANFIKDKCYTPDVHLSDFRDEKGILKIATMQKAYDTQWFPHLIEDIYGINDNLDIETLTQHILIKDYFANRLRLHPSAIVIANHQKVANKAVRNKYYHYNIKRNGDEFIIEEKGESNE